MSETDYTAREEATTDSIEAEVDADLASLNNADGEVDVEALKRSIEKLQAANRNLSARAKSLERKVAKPSTDKLSTNTPTDTSVDERILKKDGFPDELLQHLKRVATFNGTGLIEALSDPLFTTEREKYEREQADKQASLGASKGSGEARVKKTLATPGLTAEEHRKMWQSANKR